MPINRHKTACYRPDMAVCVGGIFGVAGKANGPAGSIWSPTRRGIRDAGRGALVSMRPESGNEKISGALHEVARREEDVNAPDLARPDGIGSRWSSACRWAERVESTQGRISIPRWSGSPVA